MLSSNKQLQSKMMRWLLRLLLHSLGQYKLPDVGDADMSWVQLTTLQGTIWDFLIGRIVVTSKSCRVTGSLHPFRPICAFIASLITKSPYCYCIPIPVKTSVLSSSSFTVASSWDNPYLAFFRFSPILPCLEGCPGLPFDGLECFSRHSIMDYANFGGIRMPPTKMRSRPAAYWG